eukprot:EG_transcript_49960
MDPRHSSTAPSEEPRQQLSAAWGKIVQATAAARDAMGLAASGTVGLGATAAGTAAGEVELGREAVRDSAARSYQRAADTADYAASAAAENTGVALGHVEAGRLGLMDSTGRTYHRAADTA